MAIELNRRNKILAVVLGLAAVGAGAWFFFLDEFLNEPPPKAPVAASAPADAAKTADAAKPAADAPKQGDAAKPAADAPKQADAAKGAADAPKAAAAAKPGAKPIPSNPDQLVAEVIETSGMKGYFSAFAREAAVKGGAGDPGAYAAVVASVDRSFEPAKLTAEIAANLKASGFDAERMARFLELLRQPGAVKMSDPDMRSVTPEAMKEHFDGLRKNPLPAARVKLLQTLDEATLATDVGADMIAALQREMIDVTLDKMKKGGKDAPQEAQKISSQLTSLRNQGRILARAVMYVMYRKASDEELSDYVKLIDTDTGRWGSELLANAMRAAVVSRGAMVGKEVAPVASSQAMAGKKEPAAPQPVARQEEKEKVVEKPAAAPVAKAVEAPGYRRAANIREAYSRYNDLISATVMRDRAAVKELLEDGKNPNARQSDGLTPLMITASNGDTDIAAMLLAKGADPNLRADNRSALSIARSRGAAGAGMVQLLERSGAKN